MTLFTAVKSYWKRIPQLTGVEVLEGDGDSVTTHIVCVPRSGARVQFMRGEYGLLGFRSLLGHIGRDVPVAICINCKGIIQRRLPEDGGEENGREMMMPTSKADTSYIKPT